MTNDNARSAERPRPGAVTRPAAAQLSPAAIPVAAQLHVAGVGERTLGGELEGWLVVTDVERAATALAEVRGLQAGHALDEQRRDRAVNGFIDTAAADRSIGLFDLAPLGELMVARAATDPFLVPSGSRSRVDREVPRAALELRSATRPDGTLPLTAREVVGDLTATYARMDALGREMGVALAFGAVPPFADPARQEVVTWEGIDEVIAREGSLLRDALTFSLHIHVGVADDVRAVAARTNLEQTSSIRIGLGGASPFYNGRDTGYASSRIVLIERRPNTGFVPLRTMDDERADYIGALQRGDIGYTRDARGALPTDPWAAFHDRLYHVRFGFPKPTVEDRVIDAPPTLREAAAWIALDQALVEEAHRGAMPMGRLGVPILERNKQAAVVSGADGIVEVPGSRHREPVRDAARRLVERLMPIADELGSSEALADIACLATPRWDGGWGTPAERLRDLAAISTPGQRRGDRLSAESGAALAKWLITAARMNDPVAELPPPQRAIRRRSLPGIGT